MIYLLEFLGFLTVAMLLAASPLLARIRDSIRTLLKQSNTESKAEESFQTRSDERSEVRDEIRRLTATLEVDRRSDDAAHAAMQRVTHPPRR
jgi:uncharacterized membrane protein YhiD involved in acid resistance